MFISYYNNSTFNIPSATNIWEHEVELWCLLHHGWQSVHAPGPTIHRFHFDTGSTGLAQADAGLPWYRRSTGLAQASALRKKSNLYSSTLALVRFSSLMYKTRNLHSSNYLNQFFFLPSDVWTVVFAICVRWVSATVAETIVTVEGGKKPISVVGGGKISSFVHQEGKTDKR